MCDWTTSNGNTNSRRKPNTGVACRRRASKYRWTEQNRKPKETVKIAFNTEGEKSNGAENSKQKQRKSAKSRRAITWEDCPGVVHITTAAFSFSFFLLFPSFFPFLFKPFTERELLGVLHLVKYMPVYYITLHPVYACDSKENSQVENKQKKGEEKNHHEHKN